MMRIAAAIVTVCTALACTAACTQKAPQNPPSAAAVEPQRPNIIILFADDLGYGDLGSYGHPYHRTPNLDRLAAEGQRWTDFYVAAPVCSPSRGALLTGRLPNRTGLYGRRLGVLFPGDTVGIPTAEVTLAEALKTGGYRTGIIGKWHLGDAPDNYPTRHGFDYWYGIPYSNDMDWVGELGIDELSRLAAAGKSEQLQAELSRRAGKYFEPENAYWNVPVLRSRTTGQGWVDEQVARPAQQDQLTARQTAEAVSFIGRNRDRPFFLYLPYNMPHTPLFRSADFAGRSRAGRYGDVIEELDWSVGRIVEALQAAGIAERSLVVFTSDNGPWLTMNQHGGTAGLLNHGKGTTYEGGMRVPAIFWWPGRIAPAVVSDIGSAMDLYPTALALAGVEVPASLPTDGFDLSAPLFERRPSPRRHLAYYRQGELHAYRLGDFKLHLVTAGAYGQPPDRTVHDEPLLYRLNDDPAERFDVAARYPDKVAELKAAIEDHQSTLEARPPLFDQRLARLNQGER